MCGRFNEHLPKMKGWAETLQEWPEHAASYNRAPTTGIRAFRSDAGEVMRWGMIPSWSKEFSSKYATFNARIETVADKPTFKNAWSKAQRCLIPMGGYYEWRGEKGSKQPVYITDRNAGGIVAAGLYEYWSSDGVGRNDASNAELSCTMLTMPADRELQEIHPRMPIMLTPETAKEWLSGQQDLPDFERPPLIYYPVSTAVGNVRNDNSRLIEEFACQ